MEIQELKQVGKARMIIADMLWFAVFLSVWGGLIMLWNTWWAVLLVPVFACMLAGLSETMHQGVHSNLCGRIRWLNDLVGKITGAMVNIDFTAYRDFHLGHHRLVNTPDDPERMLYTMPSYVTRVEGWKDRSRLGRLRSFVGVMGWFFLTMFVGFNSSAWHVLFMRLAIPAGLACLGYAEGLRSLIPVKIIVAWYLPFFMYLFVDFFLTQSEHYATEGKPSSERVDLEEQYQISWNLKLPWPLSFFVFSRNLHAEHHVYPAMHWWFARDRQSGRTLRLADYLKWWWAFGPRMAPSVAAPP